MNTDEYLTQSARTVSGGTLATHDAAEAGRVAGLAVGAVARAARFADRVKRALYYGTPLPSAGGADGTDPTYAPLDPGIDGAESIDLLHAALGLATEAAEFVEAVAERLRGGDLDRINLLEELGDLEWYMALAHRTLHTTPEQARERNIAKLRRRFPDRFNADQAVARDLEAERRVLEEAAARHSAPAPSAAEAAAEDHRDATETDQRPLDGEQTDMVVHPHPGKAPAEPPTVESAEAHPHQGADAAAPADKNTGGPQPALEERMTRQISLDTETTGFDPATGDRLVEIGAVEMIDGITTGREFHTYVNPCRDVPVAAVEVHGLTSEFLRDKPLFDEIAQSFLDFIGDAQLVIHNAEFDTKFLNAELRQAGKPLLDKARIVDSLGMARKKFPGSPASLDALCRRFSIGLEERKRQGHGALIDAKLLAAVYLELSGGRQRTFELMLAGPDAGRAAAEAAAARALRDPEARRLHSVVVEPTADELAAHEELLKRIPNPLWKRLAVA